MRILIADDHRLIVEGVKLKLDELWQGTTYVVAANAEELAEISGQTPTPDLDLALVDMAMPGAHGMDHLKDLHAKLPSLPIVVLSGSEDPDVIRGVLDMGLRGYIPKSYSPDVMLSAVRLVMSGGVYVPPRALSNSEADPGQSPGKYGKLTVRELHAVLTERQIEALRLLREGKPNKVIAREMEISEGTVKIHLAAIFRALNVRNRVEAVVEANRIEKSSVEKSNRSAERPVP
ncbi:DNA-binding NarL/FixJ family response regulator [Luteibacter sp. Sphag1AF]|uniref:response regulator n=1 Tax=Luteibacter sp. Sphag1AF TaxID=2587031 RepID=UPI0016150BD6|nr:response regulator transcription factor [Luteibacter sp. Sphag1AF]MBB3227549.1 DNA-binding NarL/FixJ family response regulator [Luteibacter sp. Sphag1AF]